MQTKENIFEKLDFYLSFWLKISAQPLKVANITN